MKWGSGGAKAARWVCVTELRGSQFKRSLFSENLSFRSRSYLRHARDQARHNVERPSGMPACIILGKNDVRPGDASGNSAD